MPGSAAARTSTTAWRTRTSDRMFPLHRKVVVADMNLQMTLPLQLVMVHGFRRRFDGWARGVQGREGYFPWLPTPSRSCLMDVVLFYQVMSVRGQVQVPEQDWERFLRRLMGGLMLGTTERGEQHLEDIAYWLRTQYPVRVIAHVIIAGCMKLNG